MTRALALALLVLSGCVASPAAAPHLDLETFTRAPTTLDVDSGPDTVTCNMTVTTTGAAILDVTCAILSPSGTRMGCAAYTESSDVWSCSITIPQNGEGNTWIVEYVAIRDTSLVGGIVTHLEMEADQCPSGCITVADTDLDIPVTSTSADTDGPSIDSATTSPASPVAMFQPFSVPVACNNTVTDATAVMDTGCSATSPSTEIHQNQACTTSTGAGGTGNDYTCDIPIPYNATIGAWSVDATARDTLGNRSALVDNATINVNQGGLLHTHCEITQTGTGLPLVVDTDSGGNAWVLGEFHTHHAFVDKSDTPCVPLKLEFPFGPGVKPFWDVLVDPDAASTTSALGEHVEVASDGLVWMTQGGQHISSAGVTNHSRIVSYDPTPTPANGTYKAYNLPGNRNEIAGLYLDEANGLVWGAEAGFKSSAGGGAAEPGYLIVFDPDLAANDTQFDWACTPDDCLQSELCWGSPGAGGTGGGGGWSEPEHGCYKRYPLSAGSFWPAHLVAAPDGAIWFTSFWGNQIGRLDPTTGTVTSYPGHGGTASASVGSGPWHIRISENELHVIYTEVFDKHIVRMPLSGWDDPACQALTSDDVDPTGLVAWYTFDGGGGMGGSGPGECDTGITDDSGNGHTGTCTSSTEPEFVKQGNPWDSPTSNYAYSFDGVDDIIDLGTNAAFDITSDFTIAARIKSALTPVNSRASIFTKGDAAYGLGCEGASCDSTDAAYGFTTYPTPVYLDTASGWHDNFWHHLTGVFDDTANTMSVYVDGVLVDTTAQASALSVDNGVALTIGGNEDDAAADFAGVIDDVRIYSRALSAAEAATIAQPDYNPCQEHTEQGGGYTEYDGDGRLWWSSSEVGSGGSGGVHTGFVYATPEWNVVPVHGRNVTPQHWLSPPYAYNALAYDAGDDRMWMIENGQGGVGGSGTGIDGLGVGYFEYE